MELLFVVRVIRRIQALSGSSHRDIAGQNPYWELELEMSAQESALGEPTEILNRDGEVSRKVRRRAGTRDEDRQRAGMR